MNVKRIVKLSYVYDGDTIIVNIIENGKIVRRRCRLYGFDAPELSNKETKKAAEDSRDYLKTLISKRPFTTEVKGFDKYGRLLINPKKGKRYIHEIMIEKGYGVEYYGGKKAKI
tara:strand:+ start:1781 stop:2122 length:342 start_codon:yes stop_codon:yes gene_type:complete